MKITDLPIEIQKVVFERQEEQGNAGKFKENLSAGKIVGNFNWIETPEGHSFWNKIDGGNFDDFYKKYPKKDNKQEQYYTSIPKDVKIGDRFEIIGWQTMNGNVYTGSKVRETPIGTIVALKSNDGTSLPYFLLNGETMCFDWGWLKPVKNDYKVGDWVLLVDKNFNSHVSDMNKFKGTIQQIGSTNNYDNHIFYLKGDERRWAFVPSDFVKKVDAPKEVLLGRNSLGNTGVQQFSIGDEVELLETVAFTDLIVGMKGYVKYVSSDGRGFVDVMINGSLYTIFNKRLKLINNSNSNNYGKVHSNSTTNDICTAFVPDIRSKEISTGQVFSEFDLPHIWSGH